MSADEHQDWVDRVMARSAWDPPDDFTTRVVVVAMASLPFVTHRMTLLDRMRVSVAGLRESVLARLECTVWMLGQYRELLWR